MSLRSLKKRGKKDDFKVILRLDLTICSYYITYAFFFYYL